MFSRVEPKASRLTQTKSSHGGNQNAPTRTVRTVRMAAKKLVPFHAPGRRLVYDNDPEAITRPDTVPAALRFLLDDETDAGSGFGHRVQRELSAYPGVPEVTRPNDAPTVVDAPLQRAAMHTPRVTESYPT